MDLIKELYYGNITPHAKNYAPTASYKQATELILRLEKELKEALPESERTMIEQLIKAGDEVNSETGLANFKLGFSLGVQMIIDCLSVSIDKMFTDS